MNQATEKISAENDDSRLRQFNGMGGRLLDTIEAACLVAKIPASELYPDGRVPNVDYLWAKQSHRACHALNRIATSANPKRMSPHGI